MAEIYLSDKDLELWNGEALEAMQQMPDESVHMILSSPPYWALRDYGTGTWEGGSPDCEHVKRVRTNRDGLAAWSAENARGGGHKAADSEATKIMYRGVCGDCGAVHVDQQFGLEKTPAEYVERLTKIMREAYRVLRDDGTLWLNLGSTYTAAGAVPPGYKPKDLIPIPWLVGLSLQQDGWWLRSDNIWEKKNALPESVRDRPTCSHEYVLLLSKSPLYYYDQLAISEPAEWARWGDQTVAKYEGSDTKSGWMQPKTKAELKRKASGIPGGEPRGMRNARSVWSIPTVPFPDAHFAVMPQELARRCIRAGTSERGCCPECGAGWEREVERESTQTVQSWSGSNRGNGVVSGGGHEGRTGGWNPTVEQTGWRPTCECFGWLYRWREIDDEGKKTNHEIYVWPDPNDESHVAALLTPAVVLDPFAGAGTTALTARELGRRSVGVELSLPFCKMIVERTQQLSLLA